MTNTKNLQAWTKAAALTRATQIAVGELKQKLRDQGTRFHEIRTSDVLSSVASHLAANHRILERATAEVTGWRGAEITSGAQR